MAEVLSAWSDSKPDQVAVEGKGGIRTWAELNENVDRLINAMNRLGVSPGDRVALLSGNRSEVAEISLAALGSSKILVPVNWHWTAEELDYVLGNCGAKLLFIESVYLDLLGKIDLSKSDVKVVVVFGDEPISHKYVDMAEFMGGSESGEPAGQGSGTIMFYTSGTTGRPKGVVPSGFDASGPSSIGVDRSRLITKILGMPEEGRTLLCGPYYHSAQFACGILPIMVGSSTHMLYRSTPELILDAIEQKKITNVHMVPTQFVRLLRLPNERKDSFDGSSLRSVIHGGAPCSPLVKFDMIHWFGPVLVEYYGASESGFLTVVDSEDWLEHSGTVGRLLPGAEVMIRRQDGTPARNGEPGVIYFRRSNGADFTYHGDPEKTKAAHVDDGWATVGDIGYLDDDGLLYLSDRAIDMIISGGVNIYPAEIEGVLITHPAVLDVAVFGIPDDEFGESVHCAVCLSPNYSPSDVLTTELQAWLRERIAGYKVPRGFDYLEALPRSEAGKLQKHILRRPYWQEVSRTI